MTDYISIIESLESEKALLKSEKALLKSENSTLKSELNLTKSENRSIKQNLTLLLQELGSFKSQLDLVGVKLEKIASIESLVKDLFDNFRNLVESGELSKCPEILYKTTGICLIGASNRSRYGKFFAKTVRDRKLENNLVNALSDYHEAVCNYYPSDILTKNTTLSFESMLWLNTSGLVIGKDYIFINKETEPVKYQEILNEQFNNLDTLTKNLGTRTVEPILELNRAYEHTVNVFDNI